VLRSGYGFIAGNVARALRGFAGLPGVTLEDSALASRALGRAESGTDFADALHLARAQGCSAFVSFDKRLAKAAAGLCETEVVVP
jgi:predicted nucleic acid-binding protein